jgi:hypothetical protein
MQTLLKVAVAASAPAYLVTGGLGTALSASGALGGPAVNRIAPAPVDAPATQPATEPIPPPPTVVLGLRG